MVWEGYGRGSRLHRPSKAALWFLVICVMLVALSVSAGEHRVVKVFQPVDTWYSRQTNLVGEGDVCFLIFRPEGQKGVVAGRDYHLMVIPCLEDE